MCSPQMVWLLWPLTSPVGGGKVKPQIWWIQYPLSKLSILTATTIDTLCCRSAPCIHSRKEVYQSLLLLYILQINFLSEKMLPPVFQPLCQQLIWGFQNLWGWCHLLFLFLIYIPRQRFQKNRHVTLGVGYWVGWKAVYSLFAIFFCEMVVWCTVILIEA